MIDHRSVFLWMASSMTTLFGFITLNSLAILIGCAAGISTIVSSAVNIYLKIKESKKDNEYRSDK